MQKASEKLSRKDKIQFVVMPIVVVLLTATLGWIGVYFFQDRSFRRTEHFRVRLQRIMSAENQISEILLEIDESYRQIRANEGQIRSRIATASPSEKEAFRQYYKTSNPMSFNLETIRNAGNKLISMKVEVEAMSTDTAVPKAIDSYISELKRFIACVKSNEYMGKGCSQKQEQIDALRIDIINALSRMAEKAVGE